jgi:pSer/pThr/pTyr-binding forkhead associated (FHA) protein
VVKRDKDKAVIMDLSSSNGTYLNGSRIQPDVDVTLTHRDILALGALQIQVLLHEM